MVFLNGLGFLGVDVVKDYVDEMYGWVPSEYRSRVVIPRSPLILEALSVARDKDSSQIAFRKALVRIGRFLAYEVSKELPVEEYWVETPLGRARGFRVAGDIVIVEVLRAAIPFVEGMLKVLKDAGVGIVSASRGPAPEFRIEVNYAKIPSIDDRIVIIADPMLATGNTLLEVTERVLREGRPSRMIFATVVACPPGIRKVLGRYGEARLYTAAVDPELNQKGYIVPGLGDAGDRCFGPDHPHPIR